MSEEVQTYAGWKEFCLFSLTLNLQIIWPCRYFVKGKSLILIGVCFDVFKEEQTKERTRGTKPTSSPQCLFWVAVERLPHLWWCGWASLSAAGDSPLDLSASLLTCVGSPWCDSQSCLLPFNGYSVFEISLKDSSVCEMP